MTLDDLNSGKYTTVKEAWRFARRGVIIFACIHLLYEIMISNTYGLILIFINYLICEWWIKREIKSGNWQNTILYGMSVASVIYILQFVLGAIVYTFILNH